VKGQVFSSLQKLKATHLSETRMGCLEIVETQAKKKQAEKSL
jgi:hypothetical protein